jgi:hypothetical protein
MLKELQFSAKTLWQQRGSSRIENMYPASSSFEIESSLLYVVEAGIVDTICGILL